MNQVFFKATYEFMELPDFWRKLKRFIGFFRIEQQSIDEAERGVITISFATNKVKIEEGKTRQVELMGKRNDKGSWYFTKIEYWG